MRPRELEVPEKVATIAELSWPTVSWTSTIRPGHQGVLFIDGDYVETRPPRRYAFWKNMATVKFLREDMREAVFDVCGQDIMTADKVTLRMNAVVTYRVVAARQAVSVVEDVRQALYREAQLAPRAVAGDGSSTRSSQTRTPSPASWPTWFGRAPRRSLWS